MRCIDTREAAEIIGCTRKDIYELVVLEKIRPSQFDNSTHFSNDFRLIFWESVIKKYRDSIYSPILNGVIHAGLMSRVIKLRKSAYTMEMIVRDTGLPRTFVREILEDRGMLRKYKSGTNGTYRTNKWKIGKLDQGEICRDYISGKSFEKLAEKFGCSVGTIGNILKANQICETNKWKIRKLNQDMICRKYKEGNSFEKLAEEFGCSSGTIGKILRLNGVKIRVQGKHIRKKFKNIEAAG